MTFKFNYPTVVTLVAAALLIYIILSQVSCSKSEDTTKAQMEAYRDSTHYLTNQLNEVIASRKVVVGTPAQVTQYYNLDSIARLFNTKTDAIQNSVWWLSTTVSHLRPTGSPQVIRDTVGRTDTISLADLYGNDYHVQGNPDKIAIEQDFINPYTKLHVRLGDSAYASLTAFDTLHLTQSRGYTKRLFKKEWYTLVGVKNANPDVRDTLLGAFQIQDKMPENYFDLNAGVSYWSLPYYKGVTLGAEASYNRGRWQGSVRYDRSVRQEFLLTRLAYRFVRL